MGYVDVEGEGEVVIATLVPHEGRCRVQSAARLISTRDIAKVGLDEGDADVPPR